MRVLSGPHGVFYDLGEHIFSILYNYDLLSPSPYVYVQTDVLLSYPSSLFKGSGTGKVVLSAALLHPFERSEGIEVLQELHDLSADAVKTFLVAQPDLSTEVVTKQGDLRDYPWYVDADVIYCNTLAFTEELLEELSDLLSRCKPGTFLIHSGRANETKKLMDEWKYLEFELQPFSWGNSTVWIHQKKE